MNNVHFAIPEIYGDSLSYYEVLRELIKAMNVIIDNYDTIPEQIADAVKNLDAAQLFSAVLDQLIDTIATDNTKSNNAVKVYKKHDLLYATFNETVNLYESLIDFTTGTETELIPGTNIREVNISELFIELRKLIDDERQTREHGDTTLQNAINTETSARSQADTTLQNAINAEKSAREQADTTLQNAINAEKSAREQADTALQNAINAEKSAREQADTALQTKIDSGTLIVNRLWNNPATSVDFNAQTININAKEYKIIMFVMAPTKGNLNNCATYSFVTSVKDNRMNINYFSGGQTYSRGFSIQDNGNISIGDGASEGITNNGVLVPYQIFGVK